MAIEIRLLRRGNVPSSSHFLRKGCLLEVETPSLTEERGTTRVRVIVENKEDVLGSIVPMDNDMTLREVEKDEEVVLKKGESFFIKNGSKVSFVARGQIQIRRGEKWKRGETVKTEWDTIEVRAFYDN